MMTKMTRLISLMVLFSSYSVVALEDTFSEISTEESTALDNASNKEADQGKKRGYYFKNTPITFQINNAGTSYFSKVQMYAYVKRFIPVQEFDRVVTICPKVDEKDGWVDENNRDYFQMPKSEKIQFIKDQIFGINKTAEIVVENCIKSKPRTFEEFSIEMKRCTDDDKTGELGSLYQNVISEHGEKNKESLYPQITPGQCYKKNYYRLVNIEFEEKTNQFVDVMVNLKLNKAPNILSFEKDTIAGNVSFNETDEVFFIVPKSSKLNRYKIEDQKPGLKNISLNITPLDRIKTNLTAEHLPQIFCNVAENRLQLHGNDLPKFKELLSTGEQVVMGISFAPVSSNKVVGGWKYISFNSKEAKDGIWFKKISDLKLINGTQLKYAISLKGSTHISPESKVEGTLTCK